jgi:predicted dehydrogenase
MITMAVAGAGDWGRNLIRNFHSMPEAELRWICDLRRERLDLMAELFPGVKTTENLDEILQDEDVRAVVVATTAPTHAEVARKVLASGRHAFVEKPVTLDPADAEELCRLAEEKGLVLMVGHLLLYHPAVEHLRTLVQSGELGPIHYLYSQRVNLGKIRADENALWSFAPHDISVMLHLLDALPEDVSARGQAYLREGVEDVVFVNLHFASGIMGQIQLSWLDPHKLRRFTVVGRQKMVVFDDMEASEKLKIYDKGADLPGDYAGYGDYIGLRFGDIVIPRIASAEPLRLECREFIRCIEEGDKPRSDGYNGLEVLRVLEAAQRSLDLGGMPIRLDGTDFVPPDAAKGQS